MVLYNPVNTEYEKTLNCTLKMGELYGVWISIRFLSNTFKGTVFGWWAFCSSNLPQRTSVSTCKKKKQSYWCKWFISTR